MRTVRAGEPVALAPPRSPKRRAADWRWEPAAPAACTRQRRDPLFLCLQPLRQTAVMNACVPKPAQHVWLAVLAPAILALGVLAPVAARAQDHPARPVRIVVPFSPEGPWTVRCRRLRPSSASG
jgi:hypothetical protein